MSGGFSDDSQFEGPISNEHVATLPDPREEAQPLTQQPVAPRRTERTPTAMDTRFPVLMVVPLLLVAVAVASTISGVREGVRARGGVRGAVGEASAGSMEPYALAKQLLADITAGSYFQEGGLQVAERIMAPDMTYTIKVGACEHMAQGRSKLHGPQEFLDLGNEFFQKVRMSGFRGHAMAVDRSKAMVEYRAEVSSRNLPVTAKLHAMLVLHTGDGKIRGIEAYAWDGLSLCNALRPE